MFPFARSLAYARLLVTQADVVERSHTDLAAAVEGALRRWRGGLAEEMATERFPEQEADVSAAAVHGMRLEAEAWAVAWADAVNAYNRGRHHQAVVEHESRRLDSLLGVGAGTGLGGEPPIAPMAPPIVAAPASPDFVVGDAFVHYRFEPDDGFGPGRWRLRFDPAPVFGG